MTDKGTMADSCVRLYYGAAIAFSTFATVCMMLSLATASWEIIWFDKDKIHRMLNSNPAVKVEFYDNLGFFTVRTTNDNGSTQPQFYVPSKTFGGLWMTCDIITDDNRVHVQQNGGAIPDKCKTYLYFDAKLVRKYPHLDLLMSLSRSATSCGIVACITLTVSILLGMFAAIKQQIVFAMITGVCFLSSALYMIFTLTLMVLRKKDVGKAAHDLPDVAAGSIVVSNGWSMYVGWVSFIFCVGAGACWILLSSELRKSRQSYMFTSQYDQICSM